MLKYAVIESFKELKVVLELAETDLNNQTMKKEVNYRLGTFLHWLIDYYEWVEKTKSDILKIEDSPFFSGLRYANNKLKHDPGVIRIYERTGGFSFPITFPFTCEIIVFRWGNINKEKDTRFINQYKNYLEYIEGEELLNVSRRAMDCLKIDSLLDI